MESALAVVSRQATEHGATRVSRIVLRIGTLTGVDVDALRFAYEVLVPGSVASEAVLEIETVPGRAHCPTCHTEFGASRGFIFQCPECGNYSGDLRAGRELEISRLEFPSSP